MLTKVSLAVELGDNKFTGKIGSVTIDLKDIKTTGSDAMEHAMHEASKRKTLSD